MRTHIGRVTVSTVAFQIGGLIFYDTLIIISYAEGHGKHYERWDTHLTDWQAWFDHAMTVAHLRLGLELEPAAMDRCARAGCGQGLPAHRGWQLGHLFRGSRPKERYEHLLHEVLENGKAPSHALDPALPAKSH